MQSLVPSAARRQLGDLIGHSREIVEAQGYLTTCVLMGDVSALPRARHLLGLLLNEIHGAMMRYCAHRAWDLAPVALLLAPPPEVERLAGRTALVYGQDDGRWACQEVVSVSPWSPGHSIGDPVGDPDGGAAPRYHEFATLDGALAAALAEGYVWLAAILERGDSGDGFDWRPIAQA